MVKPVALSVGETLKKIKEKGKAAASLPYGKILTPLRGIVTRQRAAAPGCGAQKTLRRVILPRCGGAVPGCRGVTPVKIIRMTWHRVNMTLWGVKTPPINRTEERSSWLLEKTECSICSTHQVLDLQYIWLYFPGLQ